VTKNIMNNKSAFLILFAFILTSHLVSGQSVRRSVICSIGASEPVGDARIRSTVGQPPNTGTIFTADNYLRQGFQQPSSCVTAPEAAFAIDLQGQEVCGGPYQFFYLDDPRPETTFLWDFGQGAMPDTSILQNPEGITFLSTGFKTITLTVTTGECTSTAYLNLDVLHTPLRADIIKMDLLCLEDADGSINLFTEGGTEPYSIQWSSGDSGGSISGLYPGNYDYTITDANNCQLEGMEEITGPGDSLQVETMVTNESCHGNQDGAIEIVAIGGTTPYAYSWPDGSTSDAVSQLSSGIYLLTLTDDNNCQRIEPVVVQVACETLEFYEVITPNEDGFNDYWVVEGINQFPDNELTIYDRWGRVVFEKKSYANDWAGIGNNGDLLAFGAYYFVFKLNDLSGAVYTGSVSIVR
jgi:gliding motility-associated-like protein